MRDWEERDRSDSIIAGNVLLISGMSGFLLGAFLNGTWQLAAESVQVISGAVNYPSGNPFYWYHTKAWTLLHQLFVPFVWLGISEKTISLLMSGLMGMLSFQALALTVWTLSRDAILAIGSPFLILFTYATRYFSVYPVFLMSTSNTHGAIGLSLFLLTIALISSEKRKAGLFLLGIFPAVHLSIAVLCWLVVLIGLCFTRNHFQTELRKDAKFLLMGLCISAASLLIHFVWIYNVPAVEYTLTTKYFEGFLKYWDSHRKPVVWNRPGVYLNCAALLIGLIWTTVFRCHLNRSSVFLLRSFSIASILGFLFALLSWLPVEDMPEFFWMMMPSRILEINNFAFVAIILGLCGLFGKTFTGRLLLAGFVFTATYEHELSWKIILGFSASLFLLPFLVDGKIKFFGRKPLPGICLRWVTLSLLVFMAISTAARADLFHSEPDEWGLYSLQDRTNDQFFESASRRNGLLLTGADLHLIQLRTRRPVLLDGGQLDMLPYAAEAGPQMEKILKEVYGLDFFSPPREAFRTASIPKQPVKSVWQARSQKDWTEIRRKFGVTEVLTYVDWKLDLPLISQSKSFSSYAIPN